MIRTSKTLCTFLLSTALGVLPAGAVVPAEEAPYLFALAQALRYESDFSAAGDAFKKAVEADPKEPYLRLEYAEFLYQLGELANASEQAAAARRLSPRNTEALRLLARIALREADGSTEAVTSALEYFSELRQILPNDIESRLNSGRLLMALSRFGEAAVVLREAYELGAKDIRVASHLVAALQGSENRLEAEASLRELLDDYPGLLEARLALANLLAEEGRHGDAIVVLEASLPAQHASVDVLRLLTLELYRAGEWQRSLDAAEAWLEVQPNETPARYLRSLGLSALGRYPEAEAGLRVLRADQQGGLDVERLLAEVVERQGRSDEGAEILSAAAAASEASGDLEQATQLRLELVDLELRAENWQQVIEITEGLAASAPPESRGEIELVLGQALMESGREAEGIELFTRLASDPEVSDRARVSEAEALHRIGEGQAAEAKLMELADSDDPGKLVLVARTFHRLEEYESAIPLWVQAKEHDQEALDVRFWLGSAYERSGRHESAIREFRELLAEDELFAPALNYLGYMWAERGENLPEAVDLVKRAVALEPNNGAYVDSLGWAYFQLGQYEEARGHLEQAARLVGDDAVVFEHLGDLYLALGQPGRAVESYRRALALADDNAEQVRQKLEQLNSGS